MNIRPGERRLPVIGGPAGEHVKVSCTSRSGSGMHGLLAHVHGVTPLSTLANVCGVTTLSNTGANRAQGEPIHGLIPRDVGSAPLQPGDGGRHAPVGCASH